MQESQKRKLEKTEGGTVEETRNAFCSSFLHCSSADVKLQHHLCSKTYDSWCFCQRTLANNMPPPSHNKMKVEFILRMELWQKVWQAYRWLTSDRIFRACLLGKTLNPDEHLHSRVWRYCSRYKNANENILDCHHTVLDYNDGYEKGCFPPFIWRALHSNKTHPSKAEM